MSLQTHESMEMAPIGASEVPHNVLMKALFFDPKLLFSICFLVNIGVTHKNIQM